MNVYFYKEIQGSKDEYKYKAYFYDVSNDIKKEVGMFMEEIIAKMFVNVLNSEHGRIVASGEEKEMDKISSDDFTPSVKKEW